MEYYKKAKRVINERPEYEDYYEPVDIGWRLCKDELPEKPNIAYVVLNKHNCIELCCIDESGNWWNAETTADFPDVVQWCRLPEPLKEGE